MNVVELVREAGVVGAGGAGFPTHAKLSARAQVVIANGAECEPLLHADQTLMEEHAAHVVRGLEAAMQAVGAQQGTIATKAHYHQAVEALQSAMAGKAHLKLSLMDSYYPAGDEKSLIQSVSGQVVPSAKLPADVGCVVCNVGTLCHVADALDGIPVTQKYVTVCGDVQQPVTLMVPIGISIRRLLAAAGFEGSENTHSVIEGGPLMGRLKDNWDDPVVKTTGGLVALPRGHRLLEQMAMPVARQVKLAMAVCCQCNMCTVLCPRNALGLRVEPHKAMRAIANGESRLLGDTNGVLACCGCNLCTHYACNFGLTPGTVMTTIRAELLQAGAKPQPEESIQVDPAIDTKRIPLPRLIARMGLSPYNRPAAARAQAVTAQEVVLPLKQHIGKPAQSLVQAGQSVRRGELIAAIPQGQLGANLHASMDGRVQSVDSQAIRIKA